MALLIILILLPSFRLITQPEIVLPIVTLTAILMVSDVRYPTLKGATAMAVGLLLGLIILSLFIQYKFSELVQVTGLALIISYIYIIPFFIHQDKRN